jgi:hypothetical protein
MADAMALSGDGSVDGDGGGDGARGRVSGLMEERLELIVAILLGLAAVATAWAAFQGSKWDGEVNKGYTDANLSLSDANAFYNAGDQIYLNDQLLYLEYERAMWNGDTEYAEYVRDSLMRDEFIAALEWYEQPENTEAYWSPFVEENPFYTIAEYGTADELVTATDESYDEAQSANKTGDTYNLITVMLAASLFVLGITGSFKVTFTRMIAIAAGTTIFVIAAVWMLTLPVAS